MEEDRRTYLTPQEKEQIADWIDANDCDLSRGDIFLRYDYWIFGAAVVLEYISGSKRMTAEIREDEVGLDEAEKIISSLSIGNLIIPLTLSSAALDKFITLGQESITGHFAEECEWPGISLFFHIKRSFYSISVESHGVIKTVSFKS